MGIWQAIIPEATTNLLNDPSYDFGTLATYWTSDVGGGTGTAALSTAAAFRGYQSCLLTPGTAGAIVYQAVTTAAASHTLSCYVKRTDAGVVTAADCVPYWDGAAASWDSITAVGSGWYYCVKTASETAAAHNTGVKAPIGGTAVYVDACQMEAKAYATTFCAGSEPGCHWEGVEHGSQSTRSALYRGGGRVYDFETDWQAGVTAMEGWGAPEVDVAGVNYAALPGGQVQLIRPQMRKWQLVFEASGSLDTIHTLRDHLLDVFDPDNVRPAQPARLRYSGAGALVEIDAWYAGGLEASIEGEDGVTEKPVVRLISDDPYWYQLAHGSAALTTSNTIGNVDYVVPRSHLVGAWTTICNSTIAPDGTVFALAEGADRTLYVGGTFTEITTVANTRGIATYSPATGTWAALGGGCHDGGVYAIAVAPNGDVYAGGTFTAMHNGAGADVANTARIAMWDASAAAWTALSTGIGAGAVYALAIGLTGTLYVGGNFTDIGDANGDYIVSWTGAAWASLGSGLDDFVHALAIGLDGTLYAGGRFHNSGATALTHVGKWNGTAWSAMTSAGVDNYCNCLAVAPSGDVIAGGIFENAGSVAASKLARWNGVTWYSFVETVNGDVDAAKFLPDGMLLFGGGFSSVGSIAAPDCLAAHNGSSFVHLSVDLPGTTHVYALAVGAEYAFAGFSSDAVGNGAGPKANTLTNSGNAIAYPKIFIKRSGGTTLRLEYLADYETGAMVWLNYSLLDGETLCVDLDYRADPTLPALRASGRKRITSSVFGNVLGRALLPGSDFAALGLAPGANYFYVYCYSSGAPTITAWAEWRVPYLSPDVP